MRLETDAIDDHGRFDARYTCDVDNSSPELRWEDCPGEAAGFAVIADAPGSDGGPGFVHWVVYNIPSKILHLPAGIPPQEMLPNRIRQGLNGLGKLGYYGPCPPRSGHAQTYRFRVFALRELSDLPSRLTASELLSRIGPQILGMAHIQGQYQRTIERAG
jgi:Raf kinase inhibitor-like YbhB/YbcL family protein